MHGVGNYFTTSDPTNADSVPTFDEWGPDFRGYWSANDWIVWHQALTAKYGAAVANQTFASQWNQQGFGAAPLNEQTNDPQVRAYFAQTGLANLIPSSLGGGVTDLATAFTNLTRNLPSTASALGWLVPAIAIGIGVLWLLPSPQKVKSARALFGK